MRSRVLCPPQSNWRIFRWPIVLSLLSLIGLIAALLGDGWMDVLSWSCLGSVVVLMLVAYRI